MKFVATHTGRYAHIEDLKARRTDRIRHGHPYTGVVPQGWTLCSRKIRFRPDGAPAEAPLHAPLCTRCATRARPGQ